MENSKNVIQRSGHSHLSHVMSNTVDMTQVEKYFSQHVLADKLSLLDIQSCRVENASTS